MKPKKKKIMQAEAMPSLCNYYARQYQGIYSSESTNIFQIKRIKEFGIPHKHRSQYIYSPDKVGIIVATDAPDHDLADWIEYMDDHILAHWKNPDPVLELILEPEVKTNKDGTEKKKAGRKPGTIVTPISSNRKLEILKAIRHNQKTGDFTQHELAGKLGISASYLSQMKKKHLTTN